MVPKVDTQIGLTLCERLFWRQFLPKLKDFNELPLTSESGYNYL